MKLLDGTLKAPGRKPVYDRPTLVTPVADTLDDTAVEHGSAPTSGALALKVELWSAENIRLGHGLLWVAEDAPTQDWEAAVRRLGMKLGAMIEAHRRRSDD